MNAETLDDVLRNLYPSLLAQTDIVKASRGETKELTGVLLVISKPRARLSRSETRGKPFSCLGELLWYLSRDNSLDFIRYYIQKYADESDDGITVFGGYGPRLFKHRGIDQIRNVTELLRTKSNTRRAVIQLFDAEDLDKPHREIPCTTTLQFVQRDNKLHCIVTMRSNDAFKGLPHDVFCFTMLQEILARSLGVELGVYKHFVGSMHLYAGDFVAAKQYLKEAIQPRIEMPEMPDGDPWGPIRKILEAEDHIRRGEIVDTEKIGLDPYWADLIRLLQIFHATGNVQRIEELKSAMAFKQYGAYIIARKDGKVREIYRPTQLKLL